MQVSPALPVNLLKHTVALDMSATLQFEMAVYKLWFCWLTHWRLRPLGQCQCHVSRSWIQECLWACEVWTRSYCQAAYKPRDTAAATVRVVSVSIKATTTHNPLYQLCHWLLVKPTVRIKNDRSARQYSRILMKFHNFVCLFLLVLSKKNEYRCL